MCFIGNEKATLGGPWYRETPEKTSLKPRKYRLILIQVP